MAIRKVGVFGGGQMGAGIVQVCAAAGYDVLVGGVNQERLNRRMDEFRKSLATSVQRGRMEQEQMDQILARVTSTINMQDFESCDLVIEAIVEEIQEKRKLFAQFDAICPPETIFATNTSSLSVIEMAVATKRIDRFIGLHFFNPVPALKLVEVVQTICSSDEVIDEARKFVESIGKTAVLTKDTPGFIVNYLLIPYLCEAIRLYDSGVATKEDIDSAMMLGCNHPMGPLALADLIGLDTVYHIMESFSDEFKDPRFSPPTLLKRMVVAGQLGRKTGKGFHDYTARR